MLKLVQRKSPASTCPVKQHMASRNRKIAAVLVTVALLSTLGVFIAGISSVPNQSLGVSSNCLLYASPYTNATLSQFQNGFNLPNNSACQSSVIEGVVAFLTSLFMGIILAIYLWYIQTRLLASVIAVLSSVLTIFVAAITAIASIGLYQTSILDTTPGFDAAYHSVFSSIIAGWIACGLLFFNTMFSWYS